MLGENYDASDDVEEEEIDELKDFVEDLSDASDEGSAANEDDEEDQPARRSTEATVLNLCHAIGGFEREPAVEGGDEASRKWTYVLGDECLGCLRDLRKVLRKHDSDPDKTILRFLGRQRVLSDLIAILTYHATKERICMAVVELLVPMTWPVSIESEHAPELLEILRTYKEGFTKPGPFKALLNIMVRIMSIPSAERGPRDNAMLKHLLMFIINLLSIKDPQASIHSTTENFLRANLQDELLARLEEEHILEFLVTLASSLTDFRFAEWNLDLLEIFHLIFLDRDAKDLFSSERSARGEPTARKDSTQERTAQPAFKPSRHSRFGGAFTIKLADGRPFNVFQQSAAFVPTDQLLDKGKKNKPQRAPQVLATETVKKKTSIKTTSLLRNLADSILESAFNPFIASVKREFDIESTKVRDSHIAQFFSVCSFFLQYQLEGYKDAPDADAYNFEGIASLMNLRMLMFTTRKMQLFLDEKQWANLFVCLGCFKDMLISLETMETLEEDQLHQVSESMQHNLFYESARMDLIEKMCKSYKPTVNSRGYLVRIVETIHLFLRMLERFSKKKKHLYVKSVKSKPKKKPKAAVEEEVDGFGGAESEDDSAAGKTDYREVEFDFKKVEMKFASQSVIGTYCLLLKEYATLSEHLLHCITRMFYRISVKQSFDALFFQVSTLKLFNSIVINRRQLPPSESSKELLQLIQHVVRKFVTGLQSNPLLGIEVFFGKTRHDCRTLEMSAEELRELEEKKLADATIHSEDEVEVKKSLRWSEQVGVAVAVLLDTGKTQLLKWLLQELDAVAAAREPNAETLRRDDPEDNDAELVTEYYQVHYVATEDEDISRALKRHAVFRLLLTLVGFEEEREGGNPESDDDRDEDEDGNPIVKVWTLPGNMNRIKLEANKEMIEHYIDNPVRPEGKDATKFLRKRKPRAERQPRERKQKEKKAKEEKKYTLSEQFVKDDSEDSDEEFFRLEAERRERYRLAAEAAMAERQKAQEEAAKLKPKSAKNQSKKAAGKRKKDDFIASDNDDAELASPTEPTKPRKSRARKQAVSSDSDDAEASDPSSSDEEHQPAGSPPKQTASPNRETRDSEGTGSDSDGSIARKKSLSRKRSPNPSNGNAQLASDDSDNKSVSIGRQKKTLKRPTVRSASESDSPPNKSKVRQTSDSEEGAAPPKASSPARSEASDGGPSSKVALKRRRVLVSDDDDE